MILILKIVSTFVVKMFSYNVNHLQEVLINIKKVETLEKKLKKLEDENNELKLEKNNLESRFTSFCQDLVNSDFLEIGKEPYACEQCKKVVPGDLIKYSYMSEAWYVKYICVNCS